MTLEVVTVGFSGPDGSGKTTLTTLLGSSLAEQGVPVVHTYTYGCFLCRRVPTRSPGTPPGAGAGGSGIVRELHAIIDASELLARLIVAQRRVSAMRPATGNGGLRVVLTDRSPLDGLVKHRPASAGLAIRLYEQACRRFRFIALLDAPPEVLADRKHEQSEPELAALRRAFAEWARRLPGIVVRVPPDNPALVAQDIESRIRAGVRHRVPVRGPA